MAMSHENQKKNSPSTEKPDFNFENIFELNILLPRFCKK